MVKNLSEMSQTFKTGDAREWTKKVDLGGSGPVTELGQTEGAVSKTFGDFLKDSITKVNSLQQEANVAMEKLASGESKNIHETLLAVEQAEMAFKMMNQVRTKVIDAYKEIMRMQI
jgi:flagellar hook-basal body complex protein FliE